MDQANGLRNLFSKESSKDRVISAQHKLRQAIIRGEYNDLHKLMLELEDAQSDFESRFQ
ncbi:hypothetical protein L4D09_22885 [Photobacterium makurazakiensis]|uniref:hypothetical protein n=1 Tax=Photobacterium makurazakiensis TaxID=2910234 RepID=UPI003D12C356